MQKKKLKKKIKKLKKRVFLLKWRFNKATEQIAEMNEREKHDSVEKV